MDTPRREDVRASDETGRHLRREWVKPEVSEIELKAAANSVGLEVPHDGFSTT